jgi:UDP-N-acetyl-D-mannosaminuronate dehydrogenase
LEHRGTLIVGVGEVGGALAEVLDRVEPVLRQDLEPREFKQPIGVMHLCIPYQSRAQFEDAAVEYIARLKPELVIVNSTVVPGTTRAIGERSGAKMVYSPVRGKHVRMAQDLLRYDKFIAAASDDGAALAAAHFAAAGMKTRRVAKLETLELAKLAETSYFGVQIAFAQELNRYAERTGADYSEAIGFFEEIDFLPRTRYYPGFIGGHCVIPNLHLLKQIAASPLFDAILESNQRRAAELARETNGAASSKENGEPRPHESKVLAHR